MLSALIMRRFLALAAPFALGPFLAACATADDKYPSLAIRDVERAQGQFEPAPPSPLEVPEVAVPLAGSLEERLSALGRQAAAAHEAFLSSTPAATRLANSAAGSAVGTPAWAAAQVALADLDSARSATAIPLADLDTLMVAAAVQAQDVGTIEAVRQQVLALVGQQDETLARLRSQIR